MTAAWTPKNSEYEAAVRQGFERQRLAPGRVRRPGRTLTVCLAEVFSIEGPPRAPIATMLSTAIVRPARDVGSQVER